METIIPLLLALIIVILLVICYRERSKRENDLRRYRDAATKHRSLVAVQKDELITAIVKRAKLYDKGLPACNLSVFNKVAELYADPALEHYEFPIDEHDDGQDFSWTRQPVVLSTREVFALWLEGVIE